jgi:TatD DNase family protein
MQRPVSLHGLKAWPQLLKVMRETAPWESGFLLHSYSGPAEQIQDWIKLGAYFSFSPAFLAPKRESIRQLFATQIPLERLLVETDSPDMAPPSALAVAQFPLHHGGPGEKEKPLNHPANLILCVEHLARERGISPESFKFHMQMNFDRLWNFAPKKQPGNAW